MTKRILKLSLILPLLTPIVLLGQPKYRIGVCPGPASAYHTLAQEVSAIKVTEKSKDEALLKSYLEKWQRITGLRRYQVLIHYPDRKVRFWQSSSGEKGSFFDESTSAAAGRGGLSTDAKPGDNQRCFFQDTTIVLDTLRIRLGDFSPDTRFTLTINQQNHTLPLNAGRTELLLSSNLLPGLAVGRYVPATVMINSETYPVTFYFLSPDDRAQLIRSLRAWTAEDTPDCAELPDQLVAYLTRNWGGKQCTNPALYHSSLRYVVKNLLQAEKINCTP